MVSKMNSCSTSVFLGKNSSPLNIISSIAFVAVLFFYVFAASSYFHVYVSVLEDRVNFHEVTSALVIDEFVDKIVIISGMVLWLVLSLQGRPRFVISGIYGIIAAISIIFNLQALFDAITLLSVPGIVAILIYNKLATKKILKSSYLPLNYFAILGVVIGLTGIILSTLPLFSISGKLIPVPDYANALSLLFANLSPLLILFLVMGSPFKLFIKKFVFRLDINVPTTFAGFQLKRQTTILFLTSFMVLSMILVLIPHVSPINTSNQPVGSDSPDYVLVVNRLLTESHNPQEFIYKVFTISTSSDRPLSILVFYTISKSVPNGISYAIDHLPLILGPGLVLAIFFLTREITSNDTTSLLASFLTAVSFHTLIGLYSGIYANWLALIIGYFSLVFLVRFLKQSSRLNLIVYSTLLMLLVFTHAYTWTILALFSGIFLVVMYKLNGYQKKSIIVLLIVIACSVAVDVARSVLTGTGAGMQDDIGFASTAGTGQTALLWINLTTTSQTFAGGLFSNFIILSLGVYWIIRSNSRKLSSIFMLIFLSIAVLPILFGDDTIQSRVLYDIPFQIPAAIGLTYLLRKTNGMMYVLPISFWLLAMALRDVTNFFYITPAS